MTVQIESIYKGIMKKLEKIEQKIHHLPERNLSESDLLHNSNMLRMQLFQLLDELEKGSTHLKQNFPQHSVQIDNISQATVGEIESSYKILQELTKFFNKKKAYHFSLNQCPECESKFSDELQNSFQKHQTIICPNCGRKWNDSMFVKYLGRKNT